MRVIEFIEPNGDSELFEIEGWEVFEALKQLAFSLSENNKDVAEFRVGVNENHK